VFFQVFHDGTFELRDTLEGAATNAFSGDVGEEPLDHVDPGSRGRREVQMEAGMGLEPSLYARRLMRGIVVNDEMEIETGGGLLVDQPENRNSRCRWRGMQVPITLPSSMFSAANRVVVPLRL